MVCETDMAFGELMDLCAEYLIDSAQELPLCEGCIEHTVELSEAAVGATYDFAANYPVGTVLRFSFDVGNGGWACTEVK